MSKNRGEFLNLFFLLSAVPLGETSIDFYESLPAVLAPPITTSGKCFNMHYSTMESDLLNSLAWDNFFVFGSLGLYCGIIYPIVPLSHSRGRLLWDNGSMG